MLQAQGTFDLAERAKFYHQMRVLIAEDALELFIGAADVFEAVRGNVKDYKHHPSTARSFTNVWLET